MTNVDLTWLDYSILAIYTLFVIGIGFALRKYMKSSSDFLTSGRSIPTWVTGLAFISANLGALELVGMAASGAKWMGQAATVVGILVSIGAAYFASLYNNVMDIIQLVFGFVNAPLFATFILAMFWVRTTGTGAFLGLFGGIGGSALFHALTIARGNLPGVKGGYLWSLGNTEVPQTLQFPSEMAQNFWLASFAFLVCFALTLGISLATQRTKTDEELKGLVYALTPKIKDEHAPWYSRPAVVGTILLLACLILNIVFW